ncbi:MAG: PHP domain-containing protein [Planctomycetota bacterium]
MHTVFSDGQVWPTTRVAEAVREGLDAIAITDHIEYQPHKDDIPTNHGRSNQIAEGAAKKSNLLFPLAAEITRSTPPGHFNALFQRPGRLRLLEPPRLEGRAQRLVRRSRYPLREQMDPRHRGGQRRRLPSQRPQVGS